MGNHFEDEADAARRLPTGYLCLVKIYPSVFAPPNGTHTTWGAMTVKSGIKSPVMSGCVRGNSCQRAALQGIVDSLRKVGFTSAPDDVLIDAHGLSSISSMTWDKLEQWVKTGKKSNGQRPANLDLWKDLHGVLLPCINQGKQVEFRLPFSVPKRKVGRPSPRDPPSPQEVIDVRNYREKNKEAARACYHANVGEVPKTRGREKGTKNKPSRDKK